MKKRSSYLFIFIIINFFYSCTTPAYFHDASSRERQKELRSARSSNVFSDIFLGVSTVCLSATIESDIGFETHGQAFKKLNLINPTRDTLYVNMLTDVFWDENDYCDFMDIRIPPNAKCKVMVPIDAIYNLYFSNTPQSDDDEMLEINTTDIKRIALIPGMSANSKKEN